MNAWNAGTEVLVKRYTDVQRDSHIAALCGECNRRLVPEWASDTRPTDKTGYWVIRGYRYPGVRCSTHERRVLQDYYGTRVDKGQAQRHVAGSGRKMEAPARRTLRLFGTKVRAGS
ncbi:hypothetical protein [Arthrobacter sp. 7Tela_A1]|uniref:hypothetical protein n=1 Tax=Arthrobacter sp. 7Tela_A1 TaxID=3093745 RepID=UPI003BB49DF1